MNTTFKNIILFTLSALGGFFVEFLGGIDTALKALAIFMAVDYVTGVSVAFIFHKSKKTDGGGASSKESLKGIVKKICMIMLVGLAHMLDVIMGVYCIRATAIMFFIGNEGLSVLENVGLMGIKYPKFFTKALEVLRDESDGDPSAAGAVLLTESPSLQSKQPPLGKGADGKGADDGSGERNE